MTKPKENIWKILFWIAVALLVVLAVVFIIDKARSTIVEDTPRQSLPLPEPVIEPEQPLQHYELKGSVAVGGYTDYVLSTDYKMEVDERGVTFTSPGGRKLLRCDVMERLEARWPDPNDPALLRYRTVYEDWGYRAVFEYVEEWPAEDGKTTFRLGPVAFFRIPGE